MELHVALADTFWIFIFSLNRAKKWFNSIFHSKLNPKYSFKKIIHSKKHANYSFKEFIHFKKFTIIHSKKLFIQRKSKIIHSKKIQNYLLKKNIHSNENWIIAQAGLTCPGQLGVQARGASGCSLRKTLPPLPVLMLLMMFTKMATGKVHLTKLRILRILWPAPLRGCPCLPWHSQDEKSDGQAPFQVPSQHVAFFGLSNAFNQLNCCRQSI